MDGYPAYRFDNVRHNDTELGNVYAPVGPGENLRQAMAFHLAADMNRPVGLDDLISWENATLVGTWTTPNGQGFRVQVDH